ncbi:substrate-binding domain-containing protein [Achromobacter xylosoxidans]|jgi:LacI family gluconate utilization system Gnt-I transcriptional repressor|uniref:Substrate-binding domain-containing protein n=1 Tax=Alcaligenes xylosoxydans xylosoxydans TaxID=85698 RepID=A0A9X3R322_ALCXX|nr:substrate-binding domain-containing protein [Achromobacter xylosoxidans]MCZ8400534.1 substrate-binding domain-containing protein [Achromobacter xylosoxidans]CUJ56002.1 HTH-type transcriptional repressor CytR [Achromobacter xylosoxidans]
MSSLPSPAPIALIAPRLDAGPAARAIQACGELLGPAGYYLAAAPWHSAATPPRLEALRPVAALAIGPLEDPALRAALVALEIPVVETWSAPARAMDSVVAIDNVEAGRMAARHLAEKRYARVACVSADNPWERARRESFISSVAALGLPVVADIVQPEAQQLNDGRMAFLRLLATNTIFDAVFCTSDLLAAATVSEAHNRDLHVPQDLAVLGFTEDGSAPQWVQGLTTLGVDAAELGRRAGQLLLDRLDGEQPAGTQLTLDTVFEARLST